MSFFRRLPRGFALLAVLALGLPACRVTDVPLWEPAPPPPDSYEVKRVRDIPYGGGQDKTGEKHSLDLYLPQGARDFPVVVLVHGGGRVSGSKPPFGPCPPPPRVPPRPG